MSSLQRINGRRAYGRAADALDPIAWRPPPARRFDARPANDVGFVPETATLRPVPAEPVGVQPQGWLVVTGGALAAAALGALLGGMLAL